MNLNLIYRSLNGIFLFTIGIICCAQTSNLVSINPNGILSYTPDANGNYVLALVMVGLGYNKYFGIVLPTK